MTSAHRMFLARRDERLGDLLERAAVEALVVRRTATGDVLVSALPEAAALDISMSELAEAFGG